MDTLNTMANATSDAAPEAYSTAYQIFRAISILPIALFAENLRAQPSLLSCICSKSSAAVPLTGCIKDLSRLWYLDFEELFGGFQTGQQSLVSSVRNGNAFPLANQGLLKLAGVLENPWPKDLMLQAARPVTVRLIFILPGPSPSTSASSKSFWLRQSFNAFHLILHLSLAIILACYGIYIGSLLLACLTILDILQAVLRHTTSAIFSQPRSADGDSIPLAREDPMDIHIITKTANSSHMDVLVGYSTQLHALTNIPVKPTRPWLIHWTLRAIDVILLIQAAALTSLSSGNFPLNQNIGSAIWFSCYLLMFVPAHLLNRYPPGLFLENQPGYPVKVSTMSFSKRTTALAFISTLPADQREAVEYSWMNEFVPDNQRRKEWLCSIRQSSLFLQEKRLEDDEESIKHLAREVHKHLRNTSFKIALNQFLWQTRGVPSEVI